MRLTPLAIPSFEVDKEALVDFDMDGLGRHVAVFRTETVTRVVTERGELRLPPYDAHCVGTARLMPNNKVLVEPICPVTDETVQSGAIVGPDEFEAAPFGVPYDVFTAGNWAFATYSERAMLSVREPSFEDDIVTVFDATSGRRLFGLSDILRRRREEPDAYAVTRGCATRGGEFTFIAFGSVWLWTLDAATRMYHAVLPQAAFQDSEDIEAVATDSAAAILMFARQDGLELAWVDRGTGNCLRREVIALGTIAQHIEDPLWRRPAGDWGLNARVRGLDGGRFLVCTPQMALLLHQD